MPSLDLEKAFTEYVASRRQGFGHDRNKTIGSSEMGACALRVGRRKVGKPADKSYKDGGGFALRGDVMEDQVSAPVLEAAIKKLGGTLMYAGQENQLSLINEKAMVSATPDGLAVGVPKDALAPYGVKDLTNGAKDQANRRACFAVEFKSIDPRANVERLPDPKHVDQVNLAMGLMRDYADIEWQPNYALIVYRDASDYSKINAFAVKFDEDGFHSQLARAKHLMAQVAKGPKAVETLRPEGKIAGGKECRNCEFAEQCLGYSPMVPKTIRELPSNIVVKANKLASSIKEAKEAEAEWKEHKDKTTARLKELLIASKTKFAKTDVFEAEWRSSEGRETYDTAAMAAELKRLGVKNVDKRFKKKGKPSENLSVKFVGALASN